MATMTLSASHAEPSGSGFSVVMHLDGRPDPMPARDFEAKSTDDVQKALADYMAEAAKIGEPLVVCVTLKSGRAPNGFKAWRAKAPFYHRVNV